MTNSISTTTYEPELEPVPKPKRISPFVRRVKATSVRIQQRDIEILQALYSYRLLTTSQLTRMFFTTKRRAEQRLRQLFDAELVERIFRPVVVGRAEIIYVLDNNGVSLLASETGRDRGEVNEARTKAKKLKPFFLDHFIEVNQFRLSATLACTSKDVDFLFWKYAHELQNRNKKGVLISDRVVDPENIGEKIPITPDGFLGLETPQGRAYYFVEVDRGTMDNPRFLRKMRGYARYWLDDVFTEKWGYSAFRVLTSTTTKRRVENLLKTTNRLNEKKLLSIFHFTEQENITPEQIFSDIWQLPNREGRNSLL